VRSKRASAILTTRGCEQLVSPTRTFINVSGPTTEEQEQLEDDDVLENEVVENCVWDDFGALMHGAVMGESDDK